MSETATDNVTFGNAFQQGVREEMRRDERIFVIGTDLFHRGGHFAQVKGLGEEFGRERIRDAPISEAAIVAAGVGAAMNGMRPLVDLNFVDFALGAADEIVNQAAKMRYMSGAPVPLVIRASSGIALYAAQHNNSFEGWFASTPGLLLATPSTPADTKGLIKSALRGEDPVIFLMHKRLMPARGPVGGPDDLVPFGQAVVRRSGRDVTLVSYSYPVRRVLEAAERLAAEDIDAEVIDLRTPFPLDLETIEASVKKTGRALVIDEAPRYGGVGAEVAAAVQEGVFDYLDAPVLRVGAVHAPIAHSPVLMEAAVPNVDGIVRAVRHSIGRWPSSAAND
jgi:acetoin:2,6-dichlorophenolindophenol oxidoreductase subunit beta